MKKVALTVAAMAAVASLRRWSRPAGRRCSPRRGRRWRRRRRSGWRRRGSGCGSGRWCRHGWKEV